MHCNLVGFQKNRIMNWGKKITIAYLAFVALIVTMVVVSVRQKVDLVSADYYAKELNYQSDLNKLNNAKALSSQLNCIVLDNALQIQFPTEHSTSTIQGKVFVYKPSDNKSDRTIAINATDGIQVIPTTEFAKGMYKVIVDWTVDGKEFQAENIVVINN